MNEESELDFKEVAAECRAIAKRNEDVKNSDISYLLSLVVEMGKIIAESDQALDDAHQMVIDIHRKILTRNYSEEEYE